MNNQDWLSLTAREAYQFGLLPLVIWREARNQSYEAMLAVAWVVKNRVASPKWWGSDYPQRDFETLQRNLSVYELR